MLQQLGNSPFPVFMLLNTLDNAEYDALPKPQQQRLIGSVQPNNHSVGKRLTEDLIALFQQKASRAPLTLYALQGDYTTPASLARQQGMLSALANVPSIRVIDSTVVNWSRHQAYTKALGLIQRQAIDVVWAANDPMAFGAKQALQELSQQGTTLIGGINWDAQDSQFPLDVSYGGHVTLGALAMVMLHDFHHALAEKDHMHQVVDIFERGTPTHIAAFNQLLTDNHLENVDFRQFSKASPAPRPFTIDNILGTGKQQ
ncbi:substrate-binding domain-containing protein [Aestuariibacter halophilus]|uniref:Substrate-binding domain-containing protein n=1 Tax=Fluctibacter halophilus TaxID=226011 RepID=A0ABS8GCA6_9ALTE|nr:substrate-binding domain-containing protein [Aestuariibacter halophilus]MCC2618202.1 substrate-binding domain-containing protein [Aestuariibacter halophilus]